MRDDARSRPRIRLFRSDLLEHFTLISPRMFLLTWLPILLLVARIAWGTASLATSVGLVMLGLMLWTLFEYAMHRFVFHWEIRSNLGRWLMFLTHGNHHADPGDPGRNLMPPLVSMVICGSVWLVFLLAFGAVGSLLFLGFAIGYVVYDSVHFACHQIPMRGPLLRRLRRHHTRHHHARREGNYAITAIVWDRVFGTRIPARRD